GTTGGRGVAEYTGTPRCARSLDWLRATPLESRHPQTLEMASAARRKGRRLMTNKSLIAAGFAAAMLLPCLAVAQGTTQGAAQGDAQSGRGKSSTCIGCHEIPGYKSSFPS